jgi:hypothetical protein
MANFTSEDEMKELLKSVCPPEAPSPEFKDQLLRDLTRGVEVATRPRWRQPRVLVPMAATLISVAIGYGTWLGQVAEARFLP